MNTVEFREMGGGKYVHLEDVTHLIKELMVMKEALVWAYEMFESRDQMNAKVHCAPLRLSPITERCKLALDQCKSV